ncbi:MAG: tetratricopeptide repeat protein [Candidatus Eisenbacteria bacterium]|uniref:Tetratricopeptide repeat protein n=1 Tax=Eiseniibacteriota bacterium TaxID=2212470 RepID=A0A538U3S3_UNCEI|nr:MAG: tetratricopeptide repeat protein [Candidatus Eisenbacteria bacterium]
MPNELTELLESVQALAGSGNAEALRAAVRDAHQCLVSQPARFDVTIEFALLAADADEHEIARPLLEQAREPDRALSGVLRSAALVKLAAFSLRDRDERSAWRLCREGVRASRGSSMTPETLHNAAVVALACRRVRAARSWWAGSLASFRSAGDTYGQACSAHNLAVAEQDEGCLAEAESLYRESVAAWRSLGDRENLAESLQGLGEVLSATRRHQESVTCFAEALEITVDTRLFSGIAESLEGVATGLVGLRRLEQAGYVLGVASRVREERDCPLPQDHRHEVDELIERLKAKGGAEAEQRLRKGAEDLPDDAIQVVLRELMIGDVAR